MARRVLAFVCLVVSLALPIGAWAQATASLVSDSINVDPSGQVTASGNVVILYEGTRLTASSLTYSRTGNQLTFGGPITVVQPNGNVLTATNATLDRSLRDGVLTSARLVLDRQLQLAAGRIVREDGRYTTMDRVVASSCEVCFDRPTPLWEIRANRVIHDAQERQLYFEHARVQIVGIPVFYTPRLRLPDPTLKRARGFLVPRIRTSSKLGTGLKVPYFLPIGDHADLTLTPYLASSTRTVELRFRQELTDGSINMVGAATRDDIEGERGYLFANGELNLARGFVAKAQLEFVSDPGYLFDYDYSQKDRLSNSIALTRVRDKDLFRASITEFRTLRESEIPIRDTLPDRYVEVGYLRDIAASPFGGQTRLRFDAAALNRPSSVDVDGRDVSRIGAGFDWARTDIFGPGVIVRSELGLRADAYNVGQDSSFDTTLTRTIPRAAVELRWPFARTSSLGETDVIEPVVRLDVSNTGGEAPPVEDSRIVEFDEANLFSFTRYPGIDGAEDGTRLATGVTWQRTIPAGWQFDVALGRVSKLDGDLGYSAGSGLAGDQSEWLAAARLALNTDFWVTTRSLFDDNTTFTLSETRLDWRREDWSVSSSYLFAEPEPAEGRFDKLSEWSFDGALALSDNWTASTDWRYDFESGRAARAGLGLEFTNECMRLNLSLSRRYATSTSVSPVTDFGFRVSLLGVGNRARGKGGAQSCG